MKITKKTEGCWAVSINGRDSGYWFGSRTLARGFAALVRRGWPCSAAANVTDRALREAATAAQA